MGRPGPAGGTYLGQQVHEVQPVVDDVTHGVAGQVEASKEGAAGGAGRGGQCDQLVVRDVKLVERRARGDARKAGDRVVSRDEVPQAAEGPQWLEAPDAVVADVQRHERLHHTVSCQTCNVCHREWWHACAYAFVLGCVGPPVVATVSGCGGRRKQRWGNASHGYTPSRHPGHRMSAVGCVPSAGAANRTAARGQQLR